MDFFFLLCMCVFNTMAERSKGAGGTEEHRQGLETWHAMSFARQETLQAFSPQLQQELGDTLPHPCLSQGLCSTQG